MKRFALIGYPLGHSYSQRYFEELFRRLGLTDYSYRLHEMASLDPLRQWVIEEKINGFNVTSPYKQAILPLLDKLDDIALAVGAVNCVTVENGRLIGHNTDAPAFLKTLQPLSSLHSPCSAFILGTGGAAHAVAYALDQLSIPYTFVSRTPENRPNAIGYSQLSTSHSPRPTLLVNATPVGMYPHVNSTPIDLSRFGIQNTKLIVYDLIYNPSPTMLMQQASALDAIVKDGLEMLQIQAELSWDYFRMST